MPLRRAGCGVGVELLGCMGANTAYPMIYGTGSSHTVLHNGNDAQDNEH